MAWRAAPVLAGLFLLIAIAGRLAGWPAAFALSAGGGLAILLAGVALLPRPGRPATDGEAAALDARATLGGELRSAHWFAGHAEDGPWVTHHLAHAAGRIRDTPWQELYAPARAPRAYAVTTVLAAAAIAVAVLSPATRASVGPGIHTEGGPPEGIDPTLTVAEIERQLAALLATLETGPARGGRAATADDIRTLLERVRESQRQSVGRSSERIDDNLRERLDRASKMASLDADTRSALEDLKRALPAPPQQTARGEAPRDAAGKTDAAGGEASPPQQSKDDGKGDPSGQVTSDAQPGSGFGIVAMTNDQSGAGGKPGLGLGGGNTQSPNTGVMAQLGAALRRETLETGAGEADGPAVNDVRHKTDRGTASVSFSRGAAAAAVRGRANAVPIVPEARRPAARAYFQRKQ